MMGLIMGLIMGLTMEFIMGFIMSPTDKASFYRFMETQK